MYGKGMGKREILGQRSEIWPNTSYVGNAINSDLHQNALPTVSAIDTSTTLRHAEEVAGGRLSSAQNIASETSHYTTLYY